jgi:hypothetical protein
MSKQQTSQPFPQQLTLDLGASKKASTGVGGRTAQVTSFVDAATLTVRQQALTRVKMAKIFEPPKVRFK